MFVNDNIKNYAKSIGREEITVEQAIEHQEDFPVYALYPDTIEYGIDGWRYLDGINPFISDSRAELWFDNGGCVTIDRDDTEIRFFVDERNIDRVL